MARWHALLVSLLLLTTGLGSSVVYGTAVGSGEDAGGGQRSPWVVRDRARTAALNAADTTATEACAGTSGCEADAAATEAENGADEHTGGERRRAPRVAGVQVPVPPGLVCEDDILRRACVSYEVHHAQCKPYPTLASYIQDAVEHQLVYEAQFPPEIRPMRRAGAIMRIAHPQRGSEQVYSVAMPVQLVTGVGWALAHEECRAQGQGMVVTLGLLGSNSTFVIVRGDTVPPASVGAGHTIAATMRAHSMTTTIQHMWLYATCDDGGPPQQPPPNAPLHRMHTVMFKVKLPRLSVGVVTAGSVDVEFDGTLEHTPRVCVTAVPAAVPGATAATTGVRSGWASCVKQRPEPTPGGTSVLHVPVPAWVSAGVSDRDRTFHLAAFAIRGAFMFVGTINGVAYAQNNVVPRAAASDSAIAAASHAPRYQWLLDLEQFEYSTASQNGEDGVLEALFGHIGLLSGHHLWDPQASGYFVEFGVEDGSECNSYNLWRRYGWHGLLMDGDFTNRTLNLHSEFVTAENILDLFTKHSVPEVTAEDVEAAAGACADGDACGGGWSFDMLSTDIDFNDYWVLQRVLESKRFRPRVIVVEVNTHLGPSAAVTVPYNATGGWNGTQYWGASVSAMASLGQRHGYTMIHCERAGVNCFMVDNAVLAPWLPPGTIPAPGQPSCMEPPTWPGVDEGASEDPLQVHPPCSTEARMMRAWLRPSHLFRPPHKRMELPWYARGAEDPGTGPLPPVLALAPEGAWVYV